MECRIRGTLKYIYEVCGKNRTEFKSTKSFWNHSCIKNRVKCLQCTKEFTDKVSLKVHKNSINLNITHSCKTCHKTFKSKAIQYEHI